MENAGQKTENDLNISLGNLKGRYRVACLHLAWNEFGLRTLVDTEINFGFYSRGIFFFHRRKTIRF